MIRLILLLVMWVPVCAIAHPARMMAASLSVAPDGQFVVHMHFDLLAYLLNDSPERVDHASMDALLDGSTDLLQKSLDHAQSRMLRGISVMCDGKVIRADRIEFPTAGDVEKWKSSRMSQRLPVMQDAALHGQIPQDANTVAIKLSEVFGHTILTIERPGEEMYSEPVDAGEISTSLPIHLTQKKPPTKWNLSTRALITIGFITLVWIGQRMTDWRLKKA